MIFFWYNNNMEVMFLRVILRDTEILVNEVMSEIYFKKSKRGGVP